MTFVFNCFMELKTKIDPFFLFLGDTLYIGSISRSCDRRKNRSILVFDIIEKCDHLEEALELINEVSVTFVYNMDPLDGGEEK